MKQTIVISMFLLMAIAVSADSMTLGQFGELANNGQGVYDVVDLGWQFENNNSIYTLNGVRTDGDVVIDSGSLIYHNRYITFDYVPMTTWNNFMNNYYMKQYQDTQLQLQQLKAEIEGLKFQIAKIKQCLGICKQ